MNIPSRPDRTCKHDGWLQRLNAWQGWGHWLGTDTVASKDKQFRPFKEALVYARSLKLKGEKEWTEWCKSEARPDNVPSNPNEFYKHEGWQGHGHWLGFGNAGGKKDQQCRPFKEALVHARSLKLKSLKGWEAWRMTGARPANIPSHPEKIYKHEGWQGYGHWLGTGNVGVKKDHQFLPFKKALLHVRSLKLKSQKEWQEQCLAGHPVY